ncbi:hypothetical protein ACP70R_035223 [Stipagrostis hirtigluma subsp. patula]
MDGRSDADKKIARSTSTPSLEPPFAPPVRAPQRLQGP